MAKALYIAEKPSVAQEFAKALKLEMRNHNGYKEGETAVVTWCVGHLVTMSYPEVYDEKYKKQLKVYYDYVNQTFKLKTKCYLYSILGGTLQEINF